MPVKHSIMMRVLRGLVPAAALAMAAVPATAQAPQGLSLQAQCDARSAQQLLDSAISAKAPTKIDETKLTVLPGGLVKKIQVPRPYNTSHFYCAKFVEGDQSIPVLEAKPSDDKENKDKTEIALALPDIGFGWQRTRQLVLVSFPVDAGKLKIDSPETFLTQRFLISNGAFSFWAAVLAVLLAYLLAVLALGRIGNAYAWDPVYLTSDRHDRASLSQFQIFGFTLIVLGMLTFILLRVGMLSDISQDVLLLLGISAVGAAGTKVAEEMKTRLSFENWAWLRNQGWLRTYETGGDLERDPKRARWGDLLKIGGDFDVYSLQLATFSLVVAYSLVTAEADKLATFAIPDNLKALLGLSNVVYIAGKAITPNSVGELDKKVEELRGVETAWLGSAAGLDSVKLAVSQQAKLQAAVAAAPDKYQAYLTTAREVARMLKSIYGADGTKFEQEPISDQDLMPTLP